MSELDKRLFEEYMTGLCEMYDKEASKALMRLYYAVLRHLPPEQFKKGVETLLMRKTFNKMPLPAEILEAVGGKPEDAALLALHKLEKAMQDYGAYESVMFDDPVIHAVVERVDWNGERGWIGLCHMPLDELKWWKKDFPKAYAAYQGQVKTVTPMLGIHDSHNMGTVKDYSPKVRLIGDKAKIKALSAPESKEIELADELAHKMEE